MSANRSLELIKSLVIFPKKKLPSNKVTSYLCVWFVHGRPDLMPYEVPA